MARPSRESATVMWAFVVTSRCLIIFLTRLKSKQLRLSCALPYSSKANKKNEVPLVTQMRTGAVSLGAATTIWSTGAGKALYGPASSKR